MPFPIGDDELKLKQRARRRLIGAIVLVTGLILILPRVLEKEPQQATNDIEVHIPSKDNVPFNPDLAPAATDEDKPPSSAETVTETAEPPTAEVEPPGVTPPQTEPSPSLQTEPPSPPEPTIETPAAATSSKAYYIQVGVFSKTGNAKTVQAKLEKRGLRVILSPVKSAGGERMRVRVGPFAERGEADDALVKIKRAGEKSAVIITLEKRP